MDGEKSEKKTTLSRAVSELGFREPSMSEKAALKHLQRLVQDILHRPGLKILDAEVQDEDVPPELDWSPLIVAWGEDSDGTPYELACVRTPAHEVMVANTAFWISISARIAAGAERGARTQKRGIAVADGDAFGRGWLVNKTSYRDTETNEPLDSSSEFLVLNLDFHGDPDPADRDIANLARELRHTETEEHHAD